jgi:hypothetical protein
LRKYVLPRHPEIYSYKHTAYADDHTTTLALRLLKPRNKLCIAKNAETLNRVVAATRRALATATNLIGSRINPDKTEIIVNGKYSPYTTAAENTFKWLGYSFKIADNNEIKITECQLNKKSVTTSRMFDDVIEYVPDLKTKIKVYKTWGAPVVDFFLLQHCLHFSISTASKIESLQHTLITKMLDLPRRGISKRRVTELIGDFNLAQKAVRFAKSIVSCPTIKKLVDEDLLHRDTYRTTNNFRLRTATQTGNDIRNNQHTYTNTVYNSRNSIALRLNELASDTTTEFRRQKNDIPYIKHWIQTEKTRLASYMTQI